MPDITNPLAGAGDEEGSVRLLMDLVMIMGLAGAELSVVAVSLILISLLISNWTL